MNEEMQWLFKDINLFVYLYIDTTEHILCSIKVFWKNSIYHIGLDYKSFRRYHK